MVFIGEPKLFSQAWRVISSIIPRTLTESVTFLGQKWDELPGVVGDPECRGPAYDFLRNLAGERLKQRDDGQGSRTKDSQGSGSSGEFTEEMNKDTEL